MRKLYVLLAGLFLFQLQSIAQAPPTGQRPGGAGGQRPGGPGGQAPAIGHIYGKLVDAKSKQPVEYASVALLRQRDSSVVTGMLSKGNGDFSLENVPFGPYLVRVNFMGYTTLFKKVTVTPQAMAQDLGTSAWNPTSKPSAKWK